MQLIRQNVISYCSIVLFLTAVCLLGGRMYIEVASMEDKQPNRWTVVLDAGHGGEDGGAVSPDGIRESGINLEIAQRCSDLFLLLGQETVMLRTEDVSLHGPDAVTIAEKKVSDLKNRVFRTENTPNALLLSIHQNMFQERKYRGAQVFYAPASGSEELAQTIQRKLSSVLDPGNRRTVKPAESIYLMQHVTCPAVLVECGFLSNQEECRLLTTADYQKKLALVMAGSVTEYLRKVSTNEV